MAGNYFQNIIALTLRSEKVLGTPVPSEKAFYWGSPWDTLENDLVLPMLSSLKRRKHRKDRSPAARTPPGQVLSPQHVSQD